MTLEKASGIISRMMDRNDKIELFTYFVELFDLEGGAIKIFAEMCDYQIAVNVRIIE